MFENAEIAPEHLPAADTVEWQALDSRFVRRLQIRGLINTSIAAIAVLVAQILLSRSGNPFPAFLLWIVVVIALVRGIVWPLVSVPKKGYAIRDKDLIYRSGVLWQTVTAIPFNRVQHVQTGSKPLDRRFGLATLQLYTAGTAGGDLKIHGLPADVAERLRVFVLGQAGAAVEHD